MNNETKKLIQELKRTQSNDQKWVILMKYLEKTQ